MEVRGCEGGGHHHLREQPLALRSRRLLPRPRLVCRAQRIPLVELLPQPLRLRRRERVLLDLLLRTRRQLAAQVLGLLRRLLELHAQRRALAAVDDQRSKLLQLRLQAAHDRLALLPQRAALGRRASHAAQVG